MTLSSISGLIAKGLISYKVFLFYNFNKFAKISKNLFLLCHYEVLFLFCFNPFDKAVV